jgi:hypothetical protein
MTASCCNNGMPGSGVTYGLYYSSMHHRVCHISLFLCRITDLCFSVIARTNSCTTINLRGLTVADYLVMATTAKRGDTGGIVQLPPWEHRGQRVKTCIMGMHLQFVRDVPRHVYVSSNVSKEPIGHCPRCESVKSRKKCCCRLGTRSGASVHRTRMYPAVFQTHNICTLYHFDHKFSDG